MSSARAGAGLRSPFPVPPAPAPPTTTPDPISSAAFLGVTVASLGGPLALAALYAPTIVADTSRSAGLVSVVGAALFAVPLLVWLRYGREIAGAGGLYDFVAAAAGRRAARVHAALWIFSYALYLAYTTAAIVYETLPAVLPWIHRYQPVLEIGIPVLLAAIMLAGRAVTLGVLGLLAAGQLVLVATLAAVSVGHDAPAGSFTAAGTSGEFASASGQVALLYVCGSLPLYLGGEVARRHRTIRRGLTAGYLIVAAAVTAAVFPLAADPAFTRAPIPGMAVAQVFAGRPLAVAVGVGVAASTAGVMLVEFLALTRLTHALTALPVRRIVRGAAAGLVVSAPITLISPERIYDALLKPSLVALWLSQLIVFAAYPRFAARFGRLRPIDLALAAGASLFAVYGLYATFHAAGT